MSKDKSSDSETHFGYRRVAADQKADLVRGVFDSVAERYDLMNDLMSGGIHRLWKRRTVSEAAARPGQYALDLAGGTGDLAMSFARQVGETGHVVLAYINAAMLRQGRRRMLDAGIIGNVSMPRWTRRTCRSPTPGSTWSPSPSDCATSRTRKRRWPPCTGC